MEREENVGASFSWSSLSNSMEREENVGASFPRSFNDWDVEKAGRCFGEIRGMGM